MTSADLMQRYCDGNDDAFRELYATVAPRLRGYLRTLIRDDATADDILQQTFLKLHGARSVYERGMDPVPWLYAIAQRTCIDEMRRRGRSLLRLLRDSEEGLPEVDATSGEAATFARTEEAYSEAERAAVLEALDELPLAQRTVLSLTKIQGLTMRDAARTLGTTEGAMKLRAHRAYELLRERLVRDEIFRDRFEASAVSDRRCRQRRASGART